MAENSWPDDPNNGDVANVRLALIAECDREEENCLYTSTSFFIWLRTLKIMRAALWVLGAVGSIVSASSILGGDLGYPIIMAGLALTGVLLPGLIKAVRLDFAIKEYSIAAAAFKNLQGEFRRASRVWSNKPLTDFEAEARKTIEKMSAARRPSLTPPEWCFRMAQKKVKRGDYHPDR